MTCLSAVPKDLGEEAIKSNSCGDANSLNAHSVENLLVGSVLCMEAVSRAGGLGHKKAADRGAESRGTHTVLSSPIFNGTEDSWADMECL